MGIGLFNIVAAFIGQYLGHWVTAGCLTLGGMIVGVSLWIMYDPEIYVLFDEDMVTYYFISLLFYAVPPIFYGLFRFAVGSWLGRKRISKSRLRKLKKGVRNYWLYEALHNELNMGFLYYLNKGFVIIYAVSFCLSLLLGWLRYMAPVITGCYVTVSILTAVMIVFTSSQDNLDKYGTPVVLFRISKNKQVDSILLDLALAAFPIATAYAHVKCMLGVF